ncbi:kinase-like domain-containing protein [Cokeromyces recurvatus]|uniref:kinase-like domain-containing protein n=1 Tax=Cokeromyces recurvatus TaxID=90255 RepID=UPI00221FB92B|nr:kinase-like domain-containing protein [Cokeromyces recurvatus]KAI7907091.1 kinase-like domain-containing protein [Cokeromyces recurvatus]
MPPNTSNNDNTNIHTDDHLNRLIEATPYFDIEVVNGALFEGAYKVVSKIFSTWKYEDIKFVQLVRVTYLPTDFSVLVRAYGKGSELIIDRKQEILNIITLSSQKMSPPLYARFKNGLVYGFIKGKVSTVEDLGQEKKAFWIAKKLARWHQVKLPFEEEENNRMIYNNHKKQQKLWSTMYKWLEQVPQRYENPTIQSIFEKRFDMNKIRLELDSLIKELEKIQSPIVFSHNDLLYGNIIFDEEKEEASFIDYEYGCYASRGFDIGNHFNEFAGFECEYWRYPAKEFQMKWYEWYLTEFNYGVKPSIEEKERLYKEVNGYSLASHFYWGLWAMIQAMVSDIDFNYMEYAVLRFNEYDRRKDEVLTLLSYF